MIWILCLLLLAPVLAYPFCFWQAEKDWRADCLEEKVDVLLTERHTEPLHRWERALHTLPQLPAMPIKKLKGGIYR